MKKIDTHELTNVNKIRSTRILIVDDEPFNVLGMKVLLQQYAFKSIANIIDVAYNGTEAVKLVKKSYCNKDKAPYNYGLIFMDLSMPIMDGYQATEKIRAFIKIKQMPQPMIIACTGHVTDEFIHKCWRYQIDEVLAKPTDPDIMKQICCEMIQKQERDKYGEK